jgi:hypothetical protein
LKNARSNLSISGSEAGVNFRFSIAPHKPELGLAARPHSAAGHESKWPQPIDAAAHRKTIVG